jgi:hypothetical protein
MKISRQLEEAVMRQSVVIATARMPTIDVPDAPPEVKPNKYRNRKVYVTPDGRYVGREYTGEKKKIADSEKEFKRGLELKSMQAHGLIDGLTFQRRFLLHGPKGTKITSYIADFFYIENGLPVVEDVKSFMTKKLESYKIKKAWVLDEYGITIIEI